MASSTSATQHKSSKSIPSESTAFFRRRSHQSRKSPLSSPAIPRKTNPGLRTVIETIEAEQKDVIEETSESPDREVTRAPVTIVRPSSPSSPGFENCRMPPALSPMTLRRLESKHLAAKIRQSFKGFGSPDGQSPASSPVGSPSMTRRIIVGRGGDHHRRFTLAKMNFDENGIAGRHPIDAQSSPGSVILHPTPSAHHGNRRESFLYRTDVDFDQSSPLASRASSIYSDQHGGEDLIVTPYAQVLASLRRIRNDFISLTSIGTSVPINSSRRSPITAAPRVGSPTVSASGQQSPGYPTYGTEEFKKQSLDTLDELDWCLDQLEKVQTHRSVSEMASNKFKRMLNRELNQLSETSKSGNQVSEFISATYLD